jgi:hypothetical protein
MWDFAIFVVGVGVGAVAHYELGHKPTVDALNAEIVILKSEFTAALGLKKKGK